MFIKEETSKHCGDKRSFMASFCGAHRSIYSSRSNEDLLKELANSAVDCLVVTENKKIGATQNLRLWAKFTNIFNELINRGYQLEEVKRAIATIQQSEGSLDKILAETGAQPKWKKFEKLVAAVHKVKNDGAQVIYDEKILGKRTSRERQVDISLRFKNTYYSHFVAIECKDFQSAVPISAVEAFKTKLEDISADKGVMVSRNGFQQGAIDTAKAYGIELFTLDKDAAQWINTLREFSFSVPFPVSIELDHAPLNSTDFEFEPQRVGFEDIHFFKLETSPENEFTSLSEVIKDICSWAHNTNLKLPSRVNVVFESLNYMAIPTTGRRIPVKGVILVLDTYSYSRKDSIACPSSTEIYSYTDIINTKKHSVDLSGFDDG